MAPVAISDHRLPADDRRRPEAHDRDAGQWPKCRDRIERGKPHEPKRDPERDEDAGEPEQESGRSCSIATPASCNPAAANERREDRDNRQDAR